MPPQLVYKFLGPSRAGILHEGTIRYTQPGALNDPFELRPYFELLVPERQLIEGALTTRVNISEELRIAYDTLPPDKRAHFSLDDFAAFAKQALDTPEAKRDALTVLAHFVGGLRAAAPQIRDQVWDILGREVGILSLAGTATDSLLWAHYGDSHRGFALEFHSADPYFDRRRSAVDDFYHLREVVYRTRANTPPLAQLTGTDMFCIKDPKWQYEKEWRILAPLKDATSRKPDPDGGIYLFPFPFAGLRRVLLGPRASKELEQRLKQALASERTLAHVACQRTTLDDRRGVVVLPPSP